MPRGSCVRPQCGSTAGHLPDALLQPRLARLPADSAKLVELCFGVLRAVAGEEFHILHRQEELVAIGVMQFQAVMWRLPP